MKKHVVLVSGGYPDILNFQYPLSYQKVFTMDTKLLMIEAGMVDRSLSKVYVKRIAKLIPSKHAKLSPQAVRKEDFIELAAGVKSPPKTFD